MMFRMIVSPALRNQGMVMSAYPTAALLRSLQWVSDGYVSHRDTVLIGVSAMVGAWLRRDAIASYVTPFLLYRAARLPVCVFLCFFRLWARAVHK